MGVYVCTWVYICVYLRTWVYMCLYVCTWLYVCKTGTTVNKWGCVKVSGTSTYSHIFIHIIIYTYTHIYTRKCNWYYGGFWSSPVGSDHVSRRKGPTTRIFVHFWPLKGHFLMVKTIKKTLFSRPVGTRRHPWAPAPVDDPHFYVCVYIYTYILTHIHTYSHIFIHIIIYFYVYTYTYIYS